MSESTCVGQRTSWNLSPVVGAAIFAAAGLIASQATAANLNWDPTQTATTGGGGAGTWDKTALNWFNGTTDVAWTDANTAIFGNTGGAVPLGVPISAVNLQLTGTGYTITPSATNTLALTGGFGTTGAGATIFNSGLNNTVGGPITVAATGASVAYFTSTAGNTLNLTGTIAQGAPTTTGNTIFGGGTVNYSGAGFATGKFNVQGGTTFNSSGTMSGFTGTYAGVSDAAVSTWNVNAGSAVNATAATLFLANGTGTSGTLNVNGGAITFGATINIGDGFNNGGDGTGILTVNGGTISTGATSGVIRLGNVKGGVGTLSLNGGLLASNSVIQKGTSTAGTGTGGSSTLNFNGGTLQATGTALSILNTLTGNVQDGGLTVDTNGGAANIAANLVSAGTGIGGITKTNVGVLTLSGTNNTFGGNVAVNGGTLAVTSTTAIPSFAKVGVAGGAFLSFGLPAFTATDITSAQTQVTFAPGAGIGLDVATASQTFAGNLTNAFTNFIKTGAGTLTLAGTNTYTGTTTVAQGVLAQPTVASLGTTSGLVLGNGSNTGAFQYTGSGETLSLPISLGGTTGGGQFDSSGGGPLVVSGPITVPLAGAKVVTLSGTNTGDNTITTALSNGAGTVGITKGGAGTWVLATTGTNSGNVTINGGNLRATANNALGTGTIGINGAGLTTLATGGTLQLSGGVTLTSTISALAARNDGATPHIQNVAGDNTLTNAAYTIGGGGSGVFLGSLAGTLTINGTFGNTSGSGFARPINFIGDGNYVLAGNILQGTGTAPVNGISLNKTGLGTLTLTATGNTYANGTTITGGTVALATGAAPGTGTVTNNAALAFVNTGVLNLSNVIGGSGTVTQTGPGTTTLSGANTYAGTTAVNNVAATLQVNVAASAPLLTGAGGTDIRNGRVVFDYSADATQPATIKNLLTIGYATGFAAGQLRSGTATASRGLGYIDNGAGLFTVRATLYGDDDLDGKVDINDFNLFAPNFGLSGKIWIDGDFNYDGNVDINDFNLLAPNFGRSTPSAADWATLLAFATNIGDRDTFVGLSGVPEPMNLAVFGALATAGFCRTRSRPGGFKL